MNMPELNAQDEILRLWAEGLTSGPGRFADIEAIKREARRRFEAEFGPCPGKRQ